MIKICHLTSVHKTNDVRIFEKECVSLARAGFDVTFIAVNCDEGIFEGVKIISVKSESKGRFSRMTKTVNKVYQAAIKVDADIYHFHDPELLRIGKKLKKKHGKKVIYDSHEDLPRQVLDKLWIPSLFRKMVSRSIERYENKIAKQLSGIIGATPHIRDRFLKVNPNSENINNYPILEKININVSWTERKNEICYVGGIFNSRGVEELVDAMELVDSRLNLAGNYSPPSLREILLNKKGWKNVNELGFVNRDEIVKVLSRSKIGIVTLHPTKAYIDSLPIKMFEYMAAGIPVIASDFPLWKSIIEKHNCGICVDPKNPQKISEAINYLLGNDKIAEEMGAKGKKAAYEFYNWKTEEKKLIDFYKKLS
jgi:glycosyltransferase involved in cell wall biosynthesis